MTAASISHSVARSEFTRVRALPVRLARVQAAKIMAPTAGATIAGDASSVKCDTGAASSAPHRPAAAITARTTGARPAGRAAANPKRHDAFEFRLIFGAAFAFFLFTSVLERAMPHKWNARAQEGEQRKSVIEQAREAAHISAGYAFMG